MGRGFTAVTAAGMVMAFAAAPIGALHSQQAPTQQKPQTTPGQGTPAQQAAAEVRADGKFIADVTADNLLEVRLGEMAQSKAQSSSVREFGQRMVSDHSRMQNEWTALLSKHGISHTPSLDSDDEQKVKQLQSLSGNEFDRAYMTLMIQGHQDAVTRFQNQGRAARSTEVRQLAESELPVLEQHSSLARQVGNQVYAGPVVAGPTPQNNPVTQNNPVVGNAPVRADSAFIHEVVSDNLLEVRLAGVAEKKAENSAVKQFARRMVNDHISLQNQWTGIASRNGLAISPRLDPLDVQEANRIQQHSGKNFDREYMRLMILGHGNTVASFERQSRSANSAEVRQLAASNLPILQEHLRLAKQAGAQVEADTTGVGGIDVASTDIRKDREFIKDAVADNFLEIRLGELAQRRARNSEVKEFGRQMIAEHTRMQELWTSMASRNGRPIEPGMGRLHTQKLDRLKDVSDREFDREYMTLMIQNHKDYLDYFRKEGRAAHSTPVRQLVNNLLPALEQQWETANRIGARVGAETDRNVSRTSLR
jgi:putative membrane protein